MISKYCCQANKCNGYDYEQTSLRNVCSAIRTYLEMKVKLIMAVNDMASRITDVSISKSAEATTKLPFRSHSVRFRSVHIPFRSHSVLARSIPFRSSMIICLQTTDTVRNVNFNPPPPDDGITDGQKGAPLPSDGREGDPVPMSG